MSDEAVGNMKIISDTRRGTQFGLKPKKTAAKKTAKKKAAKK